MRAHFFRFSSGRECVSHRPRCHISIRHRQSDHVQPRIGDSSGSIRKWGVENWRQLCVNAVFLSGQLEVCNRLLFRNYANNSVGRSDLDMQTKSQNEAAAAAALSQYVINSRWAAAIPTNSYAAMPAASAFYHHYPHQFQQQALHAHHGQAGQQQSALGASQVCWAPATSQQ